MFIPPFFGDLRLRDRSLGHLGRYDQGVVFDKIRTAHVFEAMRRVA